MIRPAAARERAVLSFMICSAKAHIGVAAFLLALYFVVRIDKSRTRSRAQR